MSAAASVVVPTSTATPQTQLAPLPAAAIGTRSAGMRASSPNDFRPGDRETSGRSMAASAVSTVWHARRQPSCSSRAVRRSRSTSPGSGAPSENLTRQRPQVPSPAQGCSSSRSPARAACARSEGPSRATDGPSGRMRRWKMEQLLTRQAFYHPLRGLSNRRRCARRAGPRTCDND